MQKGTGGEGSCATRLWAIRGQWQRALSVREETPRRRSGHTQPKHQPSPRSSTQQTHPEARASPGSAGSEKRERDWVRLSCPSSRQPIGLPILFLPPRASLTPSSSPIHLSHTTRSSSSPTPIKPAHPSTSSPLHSPSSFCSPSSFLHQRATFLPHISRAASSPLPAFNPFREASSSTVPISQFVSALRRCRPSCFESHHTAASAPK